MTGPIRNPLLAVLPIGALVFLLGIQWGLPSREVDPFLFGNQPVWTGAKIASLAPSDVDVLGADVDANPIADRSRPVVLNETDEQRGEIIRRYRLFSYQPDEMITLRSLSRIAQHRGDPRLYQYGGLWIYPVGAMLKAASLVGLVELRADQAYYLDRPEAFGRFYIVARLYTVFWGVIAIWAVHAIVHRLTASAMLAAAGALCFAFMPVVINMAHEAKPHLPSLALILLAALAAARYAETGRTRFALLAGLCCGGAFAMVLSGLLAFAILPAMALLAGGPRVSRWMLLAKATAVGLLTYLLFNPFVLINAIFNRQTLQSNLTNSTDMYRIGIGGIANAASLIVASASPVVVIAGVAGLLLLLIRFLRGPGNDVGRPEAGVILAAPAGAVLVQFILLAHNKPPEYARFALVPDVFLLLAALWGLSTLRAPRAKVVCASILVVLTLAFGMPYLLAFVNDSYRTPSRLRAAARLDELKRGGATSLRVRAEPAPYCMPPVDLFRYRLILAPRDQ